MGFSEVITKQKKEKKKRKNMQNKMCQKIKYNIFKYWNTK